jgi:hypothetical protein
VKVGDSFTSFMEQAVADSDYVIVVLTSGYARKSNNRKGGVGYEQQIVSGQIMSGTPRSKFIPVIRSGRYEPGPRCAIPTHFAGIASIDFRKDKEFDEKVEELLRAIYSSPRFAPPELGAPPPFESIRDTRGDSGREEESGYLETQRPAGGKQQAQGSRLWVELHPSYFESFDGADANTDDPEILKRKFSKIWQPYKEGIWSATITGGLYKLLNSKDVNAVRYIHLRVDDKDMSNAPVSVEVKADINKEGPASGAGLIYRFDRESKNYYAFLLSGENRFTFYRRQSGIYTPLYSARSAVIQPNQFNKLAITSGRNSFNLYINYSFVKTIKDSELAGGDLGIIAVGIGEFSFDNLAVFESE